MSAFLLAVFAAISLFLFLIYMIIKYLDEVLDRLTATQVTQDQLIDLIKHIQVSVNCIERHTVYRVFEKKLKRGDLPGHQAEEKK
jgi:predicted PurR-regulated permease PerM